MDDTPAAGEKRQMAKTPFAKMPGGQNADLLVVAHDTRYFDGGVFKAGIDNGNAKRDELLYKGNGCAIGSGYGRDHSVKAYGIGWVMFDECEAPTSVFGKPRYAP